MEVGLKDCIVVIINECTKSRYWKVLSAFAESTQPILTACAGISSRYFLFSNVNIHIMN